MSQEWYMAIKIGALDAVRYVKQYIIFFKQDMMDGMMQSLKTWFFVELQRFLFSYCEGDFSLMVPLFRKWVLFAYAELTPLAATVCHLGPHENKKTQECVP